MKNRNSVFEKKPTKSKKPSVDVSEIEINLLSSGDSKDSEKIEMSKDERTKQVTKYEELFSKALKKLDNLLNGFFSGIKHNLYVAIANPANPKKDITAALTNELDELFKHINGSFHEAARNYMMFEPGDFTEENVEKNLKDLKRLSQQLKMFKEKSEDDSNYKLSAATKLNFNKAVKIVTDDTDLIEKRLTYQPQGRRVSTPKSQV